MIKQPKKVFNRDNIADAKVSQTDDLKVSGLFVVDSSGNVEINNTGMFLLNPSTLNESKTSNWIQQQTPGQSDPVLQWLSSGPRTVSFTALVTAETSNLVVSNTPPGEEKNDTNKKADFLGRIAAKFAKVINPPKARSTTTIPNSNPARNLDISNYLNYYRSLLYPVYDNKDNPRRLRNSPPLVVFMSGNSIARFPYGISNPRITDMHDIWVVTSLRIRITKQTPALAPMEAEVEFQLTQYNIKSFHRDRFL